MTRKSYRRGGRKNQRIAEMKKARAEAELSKGNPDGKSPIGGKKGKKRLSFRKKGGLSERAAGEPSTDFAGLIFMCNTETKKDCFKHHVFGLPEAKKDIVEKAKKGIKLFLFDIDQKVLYGVYKASSLGGMNLVSEAFQGSERKFPAQIRFRIHKDCAPLDVSVFKPAIEENYVGPNRFRCELSSEQVGKLMQLFRPLDSDGLPKPKAGKDVKGEAGQKGNVRGKPVNQKGNMSRGPRTGAPVGSNLSTRLRQPPSTGRYPGSATWEPLPTSALTFSQPSSFPAIVSNRDFSRLDADVLYGQRLDALDRRAYALDPVMDTSLRPVGVPNEFARRRVPDDLYSLARSLPPLKGALLYDDLYREMPYQREALYSSRDDGHAALSYKPSTTLPWGY